MADIVERPVRQLTGRQAGASGVYSPGGVAFDIAIGGLPFLLHVTESTPFREGTAQIRKQQIDTKGTPGEQALDPFWWLRSQRTFGGGAGTRYADTASDSQELDWFWASRGVDPWTAGQVTLLRSTSSVATATGGLGASFNRSGSPAAALANGGSVLLVALGGATQTMTVTGGETVIGLASDGGMVFAATGKSLYKCAVTATSGAMTKMFDWASTVTTCPLAWVKQRLVAGPDRAIHEYQGSETTPDSTPVYTHPTTGWVWSGFAETGDSIYAAGYAGAHGSVMAIRASSTDGTLPSLTAASVAADLPNGETPRSICGYLGRLGIGTNRGLRVAEVGSSQIQYGPLLYELTGGVPAVAGWDRFLYAAGNVHNAVGLTRVDLSVISSDGRYPYAADLEYAGDTSVGSVLTFEGGRIGFVTNARLVVSDTSTLVASGWLQSSWVRFSTNEPKWFQWLSVRGDVTYGSVTASSVTLDGAETSLFTFTDDRAVARDVQVAVAGGGAAESCAAKFLLVRDADDTTAGPLLRAWTFKAIPAVVRCRAYEFTVKLLKEEQDSNGQRWVTDPAARLVALRSLENSGRPVMFQQFSAGGSVDAEMVTIESVLRVRTAQGGWRDRDWAGGLVTIQLRTVPIAQD